MNILYHHRTQASGAAGQHIKEMIKAFKKAGHTVDVVSPAGSGGAFRVRSDVPNKNRYRIPQVIFELFEILYNVIDLLKMAAQLKKKGYGLIYERYAIFNISGVLSSMIFGTPIIIESSFTSKTSVFPERTRLFSWLARASDRFIFGRADRVVVVSSVLKDSLIRDFGVKERNIVVLPNAVDPEMFNPGVSGDGIKAKYSLGPGRIVGFVGGFYPWHGLDILLTAAEDVVRNYPEARFMLVGDGPMGDELRRRVAGCGLKGSVIFTGSVAHEEVPQYVSSFDVGVMPDSNDYGSPIKIFEYMAMSKPVLAPRIGPIEEVIEDGVNGLLFTRKSPAELSAGIMRLLTDKDLYEHIAANSKEMVLAKHTWQKNADVILRSLQGIGKG